MPWLRIDDRMYANRKVLKTSLADKCLWVWAMDYSADQLTDGVLESWEVQMLAGMLGIDNWLTVAQELVDVQLFEMDERGRYIVHDYLKYNPSREQVLAEREQNAKRQAEWQAKKREEQPVINSDNNGVSNGVSKPVPYPYPYPCIDNIMCANAQEAEALEAELDAATVERLREIAEPNGYSAEFEAFWRVYPRRIEKQRAFKAFKARRRDGVKAEALVRAAQNYARQCSAEGRQPRHIKHGASFLSQDRPYEDYINGVPEERNTGPPTQYSYSPSELARMEAIEREMEEQKRGRTTSQPGK